jgi:flagellar biosynthesis protein FliR
MDLLSSLLSSEALWFFLVFARIGAAISLLPGFAEFAVPARIRLVIAFVIALALAPVLPHPAGMAINDVATLVERLFGEMVVGGFLGLGAKLFLAAFQVAGGLAAQAVGLSSPFTAEFGGFEGGTLLSGTLVITALAAFFASDLHYLTIDALARSYAVWPLGELPDLGAMAERFSRLVAATFRLGVGVASPFVLLAVIGNLVLGLVNRVMPSLPVYFVGTPMLLGGGLAVFMITAGAMITVVLAALSDWLTGR